MIAVLQTRGALCPVLVDVVFGAAVGDALSIMCPVVLIGRVVVAFFTGSVISA